MKKLSIAAILLAQLAACKMGPPDRDNPDDPKASNYANTRTLTLSNASTLYVSTLAGAFATTELTFKTNATGAAFTLKLGNNCPGTAPVTGSNLSGTSTTFITSTVDASSLTLGSNTLIMCISGKDDAGVTVSLSETVLIVRDETPPTIIAKSPDTAGTGSTTVQPVVNFSETILASSATSTTFVLEQRTPGISTLTASVSASSNAVVIAPSSALSASQTFRIYVTTGVKDRAGNALAAGINWDFTATNLTVGQWDTGGHCWVAPDPGTVTSCFYSWGP